MQITVTGRHPGITPHVRDYAEEKVARLERYFDGTNRVEVVVDNPKDEKTGERPLKPGMYCRAELVVERRPNVLVAPERALLLDNQILDRQKPDEVLRKAFVVGDDGTAQKRIVKLGARKGSTWQVLEGLKEGEQLIVRGQHGLKDGQPVQIVEATK